MNGKLYDAFLAILYKSNQDLAVLITYEKREKCKTKKPFKLEKTENIKIIKTQTKRNQTKSKLKTNNTTFWKCLLSPALEVKYCHGLAIGVMGTRKMTNFHTTLEDF